VSEYITWTRETETCGNCGELSDSLIPLGNGWNFKACPNCAEWCRAVEQTEDTCPELLSRIIRANSITEVRNALKAHQGAACVHCGSTKKAVTTDRELLNPETVRSEREINLKEAA